MEGQRDSLFPGSVSAHLPPGNEQAFLRFTRELDEHRSAEHLLEALPRGLRALIPADSFIVAYAGESQAGFQYFFAGDDLTVHAHAAAEPSVLLRVFETQTLLSIPFQDGERGLASTGSGPGVEGEGSILLLPVSTALRRLGVVCVVRRREYGFSEEEASLLRVAAAYAALAIENRLNHGAAENARL